MASVRQYIKNLIFFVSHQLYIFLLNYFDLSELKHHCAQAQVILVGTKADLRDDPATVKELEKQGAKPVSSAQAEVTRKKIGAIAYMECSAKQNQGLNELFDKAIRITISPPVEKKKQTCSLL